MDGKERFFIKRLSRSTDTDPQDSIQALRFLDQIDCYVWQATSEEEVLSFLPSCFTTQPAIDWYNRVLASTNPLTIDALRRAILKDFRIENPEKLLSRYAVGEDNKGKSPYFQSQEYGLRLSYLDEIEGLKEQIKFRNLRYATYAAELAAKNEELQQLREKVTGLEAVVKGLSEMLCDNDGSKTTTEIEKGAFERFHEQVSMAEKELKERLTHPRLSGDKKTASKAVPKNERSQRPPRPKAVRWIQSPSSLETLEKPKEPSLTHASRGTSPTGRLYLQHIHNDTRDYQCKVGAPGGAVAAKEQKDSSLGTGQRVSATPDGYKKGLQLQTGVMGFVSLH